MVAMAVASEDAGSLLKALHQSFEERDEELRTWRVRCLQAEAEVRALKKGLRHAGEVEDGSAAQPGLPAERDARLLTGKLREELRNLQVQNEQLDSYSYQAGPSREDPRAGVEMTELLKQLDSRGAAVLQLEREKKQLERQRRTTESQSMFCREELREMTQRAESLSEQVRRSRRMTGELQTAREEAARCREELEASEALLAVPEASEARHDAPEAAIACTPSRKGKSLELPVSKTPSRVMSNYQKEVVHCISSLRQLHGEMEREQRAPRTLQSVRAAAKGTGEGGVMPRINAYLERLQRLASEAETPLGSTAVSPAASSLTSTAASPSRASQAAASPSRTSQGSVSPVRTASLRTAMWRRAPSPRVLMPSGASPEGEHPPPEAHDLLVKFNVQRIQAAEARERLVEEHSAELDDLVRRCDHERRELRQELSDRTAAHTRAEAEVAAMGMRQQVLLRFEGEAESLRRGVVAQLAGDKELYCEQHTLDENRLEHFEHQLREYKTELSARDEEFANLAGLFDRERRQHELLQHQLAQQGEQAAGDAHAVKHMKEDFEPETTMAWTMDSSRGFSTELQANAAHFTHLVAANAGPQLVPHAHPTNLVASAVRTAIVPGVVRHQPLVHQRPPPH